MRLPDRILHTAFLLGFKKETPHYAGSGFLVAVPGTRGNSHLYVVTAKHLAERMECCPILMGFSYRDGSKALLEADNLHWYAHPTEASAVDLEKPSVPFNGDTDVIFLGLLHGRWAVPKAAMEGQSAPYTEKMVSGMSIIVPAHKILEVINQPELAAMRTKNDEKIAKRPIPPEVKSTQKHPS